MLGDHRRRAVAAVSHQLAGDSLAQPATQQHPLGRRGKGEQEIGMRVQVDEAGRHDSAPDIQLSPCLTGQAGPHRDDAVGLESHVGEEPGRARAVHHLPASQDQVEHAPQAPGGSGLEETTFSPCFTT